MSTRYGKTINGIHFHICESTRMGSLRINYFIDGNRVSEAVYTKALNAAKAAAA